MDPRLLSVLFLLMAGVLPLRELSSRWSDQPERRGAVRALWIAYGLTAVGAMVALIVLGGQEGRPVPPAPTGAQQLAAGGPSCAGAAARA